MRCVRPLIGVGLAVVGEVARFVRTALRSRTSLVAENLFLRRQLAYYQEHKLRPQRLTDVARFTLLLWSRLFDWKSALVIVKPDTLIGWHRKGFKLFWRWKARPGRPSLPLEIRELIVRMAKENPTWAKCEWRRSSLSSWPFSCHLEQSESTGPGSGMIVEPVERRELRPRTGRHSCAIMPMRSSLVTSWLQSRPNSSSSTCL